MANRRSLAFAMTPETQADQMNQANQFVLNAMRMHGYGPDSPIPWDSFATSAPQPRLQPGGISRFFLPLPAGAEASQGQAPATQNTALRDFLARLLMVGYRQ